MKRSAELIAGVEDEELREALEQSALTARVLEQLLGGGLLFESEDEESDDDEDLETEDELNSEPVADNPQDEDENESDTRVQEGDAS